MTNSFGARAEAFYGSELAQFTTMVHCDPYVLHSPNLDPPCDFCNEYGSEQQDYRITHNINFTGEKDPNKRPCPAELERGDNCQIWPRNRPSTYEHVQRNAKRWSAILSGDEDPYPEDGDIEF